MQRLLYLLAIGTILGIIGAMVHWSSEEKEDRKRRASEDNARIAEQRAKLAEQERQPNPPAEPAKPPVAPSSEEVKAMSEKLAKRAKIVETFARLFKNGQAKVSSANALVIDGPVEVCNGRVLWRLRQRFASLKLEEAFDEMNCGGFGDAIDLHSKNGCPPTQHDQLILTDAGKRRDAYASGMEKVIEASGNSVGLLAMGCDATELQIAPCLVERWPDMKKALGPQLRQLGFTKVNCSPGVFGAGPELPVEPEVNANTTPRADRVPARERADRDPQFAFGSDVEESKQPAAHTAMAAVYARCSEDEPAFREGSRLEASLVSTMSEWDNDYFMVSVKIANMTLARGNTLWYRLQLVRGKPHTIEALKPISAELCGLAAANVRELIQ